MRNKTIILLLIQSLLTSCYNVSQSNLPKLQQTKTPVITSSIKPVQVKPSTIVVNQGNPVTTTNSNTSTSTVSNTSTVSVNTPVPSPTISPVNNSSSTTNLSNPDSQTITFNPNPTYNYPPPSLSPDVPVSIVDGTKPPQPESKPIYNENYPIEDIPILEGVGNLIFKDNFKVRINVDGTLFSQTGADMSSINQLLIDYKVKFIVSYSIGTTQEELDKREKDMEAFYQSDIPNRASWYRLYFTSSDTNVKEFFEKLRADSKVLSANYSSSRAIPS